ncbi:MAG: L,D-transpeptidase [Pyrinomonadaceae bacterium]
MNLPKKNPARFSLILWCAILLGACGAATMTTTAQQVFIPDSMRDSARSDKLTGGKIEKTTLQTGNSDLKITINVPAFQLTLWQGGREVKTYPVGVGMIDHPMFIGLRRASAIVWNPDWIPPDSDWVEGSKTVKIGEFIAPDDARNPLGKLKIPLGNGYLIHQAKSSADLGSLVSHGCVRVVQSDLYDLAERITAARALPVTPEEIEKAKTDKETLTLELAPPVLVEITYDTLVVEAGKLHIYPDVYERQKNTVENLRAELETSGVKTTHISDENLSKMLVKATAKNQFVISVKNIEAGKYLSGGQVLTVVSADGKTLSVPSSRQTIRKTVRRKRG